MSIADAEYDMLPEDIRDTISDADTVPEEDTAEHPVDTVDGMTDSPTGSQPAQDFPGNASDADDEQVTALGAPGVESGSGILQEDEQQLSTGDGGEVLRLHGELAAVTAERDAFRAQCETLGAEADRLRSDCERLGNEVGNLRGERDRLIVSALCQMGAVDGEYLLEKMRKEGVTDCEQIFKQAKSRFPQLFRHRLDGIRPAGSGNSEAVPPSERSFSERMRLFAQDPDGYAAQYVK